MKRQTRKQLKTDNFAKDLGLTFSFLSEHRAETIRYGLIATAIVLLGFGYYFYSRHQAAVREEALTAAMKVDEAIIGPKPTPIGKLGEVLGDAGFDSRHSKYGSKRKLPGKERCLWNLWQKDAGDGQR